MGIKEGKILSVQHYIDISYGDRVPSVKVVIETHNDIIDTYKYDYHGEELNVGDRVKFKTPGIFDIGGLQALVKV